jgi:phospholipid/cholesterol/gamma-HCH transport system permease protein
MVAAASLVDVSFEDFTKGLRIFYRFKDVWYGLVKAASFGTAVTLLGCLTGLHAGGGASGVGRATTMAVVYGCMAILVLDALWAATVL